MRTVPAQCPGLEDRDNHLMTAAMIKTAYAGTRALESDPAQQAVVERLQALQEQLAAADTLPARWRRKLPFAPPPAPVTGIYLWGDVGRGKTCLMDLFFDTLPLARKRRSHFHRMMADVHARLAANRDTPDPLDTVAAAIARESAVLCFDEFFVSDIGDAMLLGRLLDGLFRRGVTLVATSNTPPSGLYPGGLQRDYWIASEPPYKIRMVAYQQGRLVTTGWELTSVERID